MLQSSVFFSFPSCSAPNLPSLFFPTSVPFSFSTLHFHCQIKQPKITKQQFVCRVSSSYEVGGGYPDEELELTYKTQFQQLRDSQNLDSSQYDALLKGGDQVISVLEEVITLVSSPFFFPYYYPFKRFSFEGCLNLFVVDTGFNGINTHKFPPLVSSFNMLMKTF